MLLAALYAMPNMDFLVMHTENEVSTFYYDYLYETQIVRLIERYVKKKT